VADNRNMGSTLVAADMPSVDRQRADPPVWTVAFAGICAFLNLYATQPILPVLAQTFHVGKAGVSLTVLAGTLGVAVSAPFMGMLADRVGRRRIIVASALALGVTSVLAATSGTLVELVVWRFLQGVFTPGVFAITVTYINDEWRAHKAGSAMALYVSGTVVGGFVGRVTAGLATEHGNWRAAFVVLGVLALAMTAAIWRWLPRESWKPARRQNAGALGGALEHLRNRALLVRYGVGFCTLFSLVGTFTYVTFYLAAPPFGFRPSTLGLVFVVYLVGAAVTPQSGRWLDRHGSQSTLMLAAGMAACGVLLTLEPKTWAVLVGLSLACTGVFVAQTAVSRSIGQCATRNRAMAVGLYATFYYTGGCFGATLPAYTWRLGEWPACVALVVLAQGITFAIARWGWGEVGKAEGEVEVLVEMA
jgi:predicted MFS family arabinose efflux permease